MAILVRQAVRKAKLGPVSTPISVCLVWYAPSAHNRDVDGLAPTLKACLDALVESGVIPDDNSKIVNQATLGPVWISRDNPRMELRIQEVTQCVWDECTNPVHVISNGLCEMHYHRGRRGYPMDAPLRGKFNSAVGYEGAHKRPVKLWGAASQYPCLDCGATARDWAYDGTDPDYCLTPAGQRYSIYPEFYIALCRGCHNRRDKAEVARELLEYRQWKRDNDVDSIHAFIRELAGPGAVPTSGPGDVVPGKGWLPPHREENV